MALKKRFQPKKVEIKSKEEKNRPRNAKLAVVKAPTVSLDIDDEGDQDSFKRKLLCYRKMNELYMDEKLNLYNSMKGILEIACMAVNAEGGSLWIYEEETHHNTCKVAIGAPGLEGVSIPASKGIVGWAYEKKVSTLVADTSTDERFSDKADKEANFKTQSIIAAPLLYNAECIGVIEVVNKKGGDGHFTDSDRYFLDDICTPAAMHIKTNRMLTHQTALLNRMKTFSDLHESFSSTMDLNKLLLMVLGRAISLLGAEVGSIWLVDDSGEGVECHVAEGPTKDKVIGLKLKNGVGIVGWVVENQKPIMVEDCSKDPRFSTAVDKKIDFVTKTMLCVPLTVKGECLGSIQIINKKGSNSFFKVDDQDLLCLFASSSAMYIKNARLFTAEKRANELSALIEISQEITSTLDLDGVLMSIVNLSSKVIPYDDAFISFEMRGKKEQFEIRAQSGVEKVEEEDEQVQDVEKLHNMMISKQLDVIEITNKEEQAEDLKKLPGLEKYMEEYELKSFWIQSLSDDQGAVGILSMESNQVNMINDQKRELLPLLVSQSTVALRNAELYNTIPTGDMLKNVQQNFMHNLMNIKEIPLTSWLKWSAITAAVACALIFIKVPYNVDTDVEILSVANTYYSSSQGKVEKILVKEGQQVAKGTLLAKLDVSDLELQLKQKEFQKQKVTSEMLKLRGERKIADYKIKEREMLSLQTEIQQTKEKIDRANVYAEEAGVVMSGSLDDLIGMPVNFGQELFKIGSKERLYVQYKIPEQDILSIKTEQDIKFKVYSHPTESFSEGMKLESVSGEGVQLTETDEARFYLARALVNAKNGNNHLLRSGMTGRGKIYADNKPLYYFLFSKAYAYLVMEVLF